MPEGSTTFQEQATPSAASPVASLELSTLASTFTGSGTLRGKAHDSRSYLRAVLAALASLTAIVFLLFSCSRFYRRRAIQDLRSRRLASPEDSDALFDVCGTSSGEEDRQQLQSPDAPILPGGRHRNLPLNTTLSRAADSSANGDGGNTQQHEYQHNRHEDDTIPLDLSLRRTFGREEEPGASPVLFPSLLPSGRTPTELDAAKGLLTLFPHQKDAGNFASSTNTSQAATLEVWQLRRQMRRLQRQVQRERPRVQRQLQRLKQQLQRERRHRQQLQAQIQMVQQNQARLYAQNRHELLWQQHQHLQYLLQQQQLHHLREKKQQQQVIQPLEQQRLAQKQGQHQTLLEQQHQYLPQKDQERRQAVQQQPQQAAAQECEEQCGRRKRKREQQDDPDPNDEWKQQSNQSSEQLKQQLLEDEWAEGGSSRPESPEPSTSQQASAAAAAAGASTAPPMNIPVIGGTPQASVAAAGTGASRDEAAASASSHAGGAAAASTAAVHGPQAAGRSSPASTTAGESMNVEVERNSVSVVGDITEDAGAATAGTAATAGAGSVTSTLIPLLARNVPSWIPDSPPVSVLDHPFVHLPERVVAKVPAPYKIDLRRAVTTWPGRRDLMPLLQKAHDLLARDVLQVEHMEELAHVAGALIEHGMCHQHHDLSKVRMSRGIERLGMRFLLLEAVVSSFIALGQEPEPRYWERFTNTISHSLPSGHMGYRLQGTFILSLAHELRKAMQILKTGKRPKPEDLLQIKRMLMCAPSSPQRFRRPDFDRWRRDNGDRNDEQQVLLPATQTSPTPSESEGMTQKKH